MFFRIRDLVFVSIEFIVLLLPISINISNIDSIEGAMIIVESDIEPIVKLRFISISNNKSDWQIF